MSLLGEWLCVRREMRDIPLGALGAAPPALRRGAHKGAYCGAAAVGPAVSIACHSGAGRPPLHHGRRPATARPSPRGAPFPRVACHLQLPPLLRTQARLGRGQEAALQGRPGAGARRCPRQLLSLERHQPPRSRTARSRHRGRWMRRVDAVPPQIPSWPCSHWTGLFCNCPDFGTPCWSLLDTRWGVGCGRQGGAHHWQCGIGYISDRRPCPPWS